MTRTYNFPDPTPAIMEHMDKRQGHRVFAQVINEDGTHKEDLLVAGFFDFLNTGTLGGLVPVFNYDDEAGGELCKLWDYYDGTGHFGISGYIVKEFHGE